MAHSALMVSSRDEPRDLDDEQRVMQHHAVRFENERVLAALAGAAGQLRVFTSSSWVFDRSTAVLKRITSESTSDVLSFTFGVRTLRASMTKALPMATPGWPRYRGSSRWRSKLKQPSSPLEKG
jgi:predicted amidohydrolase